MHAIGSGSLSLRGGLVDLDTIVDEVGKGVDGTGSDDSGVRHLDEAREFAGGTALRGTPQRLHT